MINEKKRISRVEAIEVVLRHDGIKGFYKHENWLGPLSSTIYRSVYFGLWSKLLYLQNDSNRLIDCVLLPLVASLGASVTTAIPDMLRSFCLQVNDAKSKVLARRNKNTVI